MANRPDDRAATTTRIARETTPDRVRAPAPDRIAEAPATADAIILLLPVQAIVRATVPATRTTDARHPEGIAAVAAATTADIAGITTEAIAVTLARRRFLQSLSCRERFSIKVGNLDTSVVLFFSPLVMGSNEDLSNAFSCYGTIKDIYIPKDYYTQLYFGCVGDL